MSVSPDTDANTPPAIYTIGHSTRSFEELVSLLQEVGVRQVADIRRFPGSRRHPQFNQEYLKSHLASAGIAYHWLEALGGRRRSGGGGPSANAGLRHAAFRSYADYMATDEFKAGLQSLLGLARRAPTAMMCAEAVYWRCHRRLVSDVLLAAGVQVLHIMGPGPCRPHELTSGAVATAHGITYPASADLPLFGPLQRPTRE